MATVITVGRNDPTTGDPIDEGDWLMLQDLVERAARNTLHDEYFVGDGYAPGGVVAFNGKGDGDWGAEEAVCLILRDPATGADWDDLCRNLETIASAFGQEAIAIQGAYTQGRTVMLEGAVTA